MFWTTERRGLRSRDADHARRYEAGLAKLAKPYRLDGTATVRGIYPPRGISAAAGSASTVLDLAKYDMAIDRHTLVRAETQERAWTPMSTTEGRKLPYGSRPGSFKSHQGSAAGLALRLPAGSSRHRPEAAGTEDRLDPPREQRNGPSASFLLVPPRDTLGIREQLPEEFSVREESLGRVLPYLPGSQSSDRFNAEIERIATQTGSYRYDAERASHELLTRWLDERRLAAPK